MGGIERQRDEQTGEANRLYWESQESVNQIADQLGLSKGALYGAIDPLPSELVCPDCRSPLGYLNRTALERAELSCASCGRNVDESAALAPGAMGEGPDSPLDAAASEPSTSRPTSTRTVFAAGRVRSPADLGPEAGAADGPPLVEDDTEAHASTEIDQPATQGSGASLLVGGAALCLGVGLLLGRLLPRR